MTISVEGTKSVFECIDAHATTKSSKIAIIHEDATTLTYGQLSSDSSKLSAYLQDTGLKKSDPIVIISRNCPGAIISIYGGLKAGAKVALIDPLSTSEDLRFQLELTKPKQIVTEWEIYQRERKVLEEFGLENVTLMERINETISKYEPIPPQIEIDPTQDVAFVFHYAGIVGRTLEVYHIHGRFNMMVSTLNRVIRVDENTTQLVAIPISHMFGLIGLHSTFLAGGRVILMKHWDASTGLALIQKHKVTHLMGPPMLFESLLKIGVTKEQLSSIVACITGAAPVPPELQKKFFEELGVPLVQVYGMTEAGIVTAQPLDLQVYGSVGVPLPNVEVKIVDKETGTKEIPAGQVGELIVRAPWIMKGYSDPNETAKAIREGWLYTGDLFTMSSNGLLYFRGIKKRMLKYKGYPIFPRDLENILLKHSAVKEAFVTGLLDPEVGHKPIAYVVIKQEYENKVTPEQLMEFVNSRVAFYKKLREIHIVKELPKI